MRAAIAIGRAVLALAVSSLLAAAWLFAPAPANERSAAELAPQAVAVEPAPLSLVCPGAAVRLGGEAGTEVGTVERLGAAKLFIRNTDAEAEVSALAEFTEFQTITSDTQLEQSSDLISAWQWQELSAPRIVGAAAAACVSPAREQWFVGGSTLPQADAVLLVHNPSAVESAVSVVAIGAAADLDFALAPGGTELVSLATLLPGSDELVVQVSASAPVASWLQHRTSRGLSATGFDLVTAQTEPSSSITIAGLSVLGSDLAPLAELTTPVLRVYNPGAESVEVLAQVVSSGGQFGSAQRIVVGAGSHGSASLTGLSEGDYAVFIDAEGPIFAGLYNPVALDVGSFDFAWLAAGELFSTPFALAAGDRSASLALSNPGEQAIRASVSLGNRAIQVLVAPRSQELVAVPARTQVRVVPDGPIAATLRIRGEGYAVVQPRESRNLASEVVVRVR